MADKKAGQKHRPEGRIRRFELRLSETEVQKFTALETALGISRAELIRLRVLENAGTTVVNGAELLGRLDSIGAELGRSGNNINQLARHANTLKKHGMIDPKVAEMFSGLFGEYIERQAELEKALRQLIRLMRN